MEKVTLQAEPRGTGRHVNRELRNAQRVPAVVYGKGFEPQAVSLDRKELGLALRTASGVIRMEITGQPDVPVLVREVQRHPTKHRILHVDFLAVSMTQKVRVEVQVVHQGHAPILDDPAMVLVRNVDTVEVECLPGDIPENLVGDLSKLATLNDEILVKDLALPNGVKLLTDPNQVAFAVTASRAALEEEEEEELVEEAPSPDEVEVVARRRPKEEEEED